MIQVKENLTEEQIKKFSETKTKEFGALDYLKGGVKNGLKNLVSKAAGHKFKAGVIYIERSWNEGKDGRGKLTFEVDIDDTKSYKSLGEANDEAKKMLKELKDKQNEDLNANSDDMTRYRFPVKIFPGRDEERFEEEAKEEIVDMTNSNKWMNAMIKL